MEYRREVGEFGDADNDHVLLQQLLPLPPVPPHTFSSIWEREVGFVDMISIEMNRFTTGGLNQLD